ncbi:hypothetical protein D3C86_1944290 [compost metagenome]
MSTKPCKDNAWRSSFSSTSSRPRFQVVITTMISRANSTGSQPPARNLVVLALKKARSITSSGVPTRPISQSGCFQRWKATTISSSVVITMVPVTAMP